MYNCRAIATLVLSLPLVTGTGTIICSNEVVDFNLIDTSVSPPIFTELTPVVDLLDFPTCKLNVEAAVASSPTNCDERTAKCVKFFWMMYQYEKKNSPLSHIMVISGEVLLMPVNHLLDFIS